MTKRKAAELLLKLYQKADFTDEYGDMTDREPYEEALNIAVKALKVKDEFIEKLIDIRELCKDADCDECYYADEYHNCRFNGLPCNWDNLEDLLKQESGDKE